MYRSSRASPADCGSVAGSIQLEPSRLAVYRRNDPGRARIEAFIRTVYADRYGARVAGFAPVLVAGEVDGSVVAAAGYRVAGEPLFLERYLDAPIDALLATGSPIARTGIVEVGHLASVRPGEGRRLIMALAGHLHGLRTEWVVSTVTKELRQMFVRIGLGALAIAPARGACLGAEAAAWGSYYDHEPIVMAGHLPTALRGLQRRSGATR